MILYHIRWYHIISYQMIQYHYHIVSSDRTLSATMQYDIVHKTWYHILYQCINTILYHTIYNMVLYHNTMILYIWCNRNKNYMIYDISTITYIKQVWVLQDHAGLKLTLCFKNKVNSWSGQHILFKHSNLLWTTKSFTPVPAFR